MKYPLSLIMLAMCGNAAANTPVKEQDNSIERVVVTASRIEKPLSQIPNTITLIDEASLNEQLALSHDLSTVLGNLIPGFSPSRQKLTNAGESLRGRKPLYLIDGVPQSNPLRSGGRDGNTIDPFLLERVEVLHGANAIHGLGAAGGIINLITRNPAEGFQQRVRVDGGLQSEDISESADWGVNYSLSNKWDNTDVLLGLTYRQTGMGYDADGNIIGVDNTQGDTMDSDTFDGFLKLGHSWDGSRLSLMVNHYQIEGNNSWLSQAGDVENDIPSSAIKGSADGEAAQNNVTTASVQYSVESVLDHQLTVQLFRQDFEATYGAEANPLRTFQDPEYGDDLIDQSQNNSEKTGAKLTLVKKGVFDLPVDVVYGADVLQDKTWQALIQTNRTWVPETQYQNYAFYGQLEYASTSSLTLTTGLRYEHAKLEVDDFTTLASYGSQFVTGGSPSFSETLFNIGGTYKLHQDWRVFTNYAEAFSMPDVGRVLRGINQPGLSVDTFLDLKPILTENAEIGLEYQGSVVQGQIAYYVSESDFGQRLQRGDDGVFAVYREKTDVDGLEMRVDWSVSDNDVIGVRYAMSDGRYDSDDDGKVDSDLGGSNVAPDRVNLSWVRNWTDSIKSRVQVNHLLDRDVENSAGEVINTFDGYTTVDGSVTADLLDGEITLAVQNLTNTDYYTYYSQSNPNDLRNFKGLGRSFNVSYQIMF